MAILQIIIENGDKYVSVSLTHAASGHKRCQVCSQQSAFPSTDVSKSNLISLTMSDGGSQTGNLGTTFVI